MVTYVQKTKMWNNYFMALKTKFRFALNVLTLRHGKLIRKVIGNRSIKDLILINIF